MRNGDRKSVRRCVSGSAGGGAVERSLPLLGLER